MHNKPLVTVIDLPCLELTYRVFGKGWVKMDKPTVVGSHKVVNPFAYYRKEFSSVKSSNFDAVRVNKMI
jgi:hypothetical protein